jgi:MerR HTH family regulatory protein
MRTKNLISIQQFCISHNVEISFISSLKETGLIEIKTVKDTEFIDAGQLQQLEKFIRFYYELDINLEGIETVLHLLNRIKSMQDEIAALRNRLRLYETND